VSPAPAASSPSAAPAPAPVTAPAPAPAAVNKPATFAKTGIVGYSEVRNGATVQFQGVIRVKGIGVAKPVQDEDGVQDGTTSRAVEYFYNGAWQTLYGINLNGNGGVIAENYGNGKKFEITLVPNIEDGGASMDWVIDFRNSGVAASIASYTAGKLTLRTKFGALVYNPVTKTWEMVTESGKETQVEIPTAAAAPESTPAAAPAPIVCPPGTLPTGDGRCA
jgi:hypothetical protein